MDQVNDYDRYAALRQKELQKGEKLPHRFVEKPAMKKYLSDLTGKRILMLGCGTGEESVLLESYGAREMVGIDLSAESIRLAQETYPNHTFVAGDMHTLDFSDQEFDFVYSSLTIHYSNEPLKVYQEIHRVLKPDGIIQFSVGHPMRWASKHVNVDGQSSKVLGYSDNYDDKPDLYGSYLEFAQYEETFASGEILQFWVGPPSMHFNLLQEAGFTVQNFIETKAIEEAKLVAPYYYERFSNIPQFMVFVAQKSSSSATL